MDMTFAEKILAKYSKLKEVVPGQIVTIHPDHLITHDNTAAIIQKIKPELDRYGVYSKSLPIITLDHIIPAASEKTADNHKIIREFVKNKEIKNFFDIGFGICHQIVIEKGFAHPGKLLLGSDSHTCSYGAIGAFSTGIDRTEAASILLTGETGIIHKAFTGPCPVNLPPRISVKRFLSLYDAVTEWSANTPPPLNTKESKTSSAASEISL